VNHFFVHRNTDLPAESPVTQEGAATIALRHEIGSELIDFFGRNTRLHLAQQLLQYLRGDFSRFAHAIDFFGRLDGDTDTHGE